MVPKRVVQPLTAMPHPMPMVAPVVVTLPMT
jgi:hypothetical protein